MNIKTLMFLSRTLEDFENACEYIEFYQLLQGIIEQYNPKIYAWGQNDIYATDVKLLKGQGALGVKYHVNGLVDFDVEVNVPP